MLIAIVIIGTLGVALFTLGLALRGACSKPGVVVIALCALSFLLGSTTGGLLSGVGYVLLMAIGAGKREQAKITK